MGLLQKPSVWAPLLGYTMLAGWALVFITGVAWLYPFDENGRAVVDLRVYMLLGFAVCVFLFARSRKLRGTFRPSVLGVAGSLIMGVAFLITVVSMPSLLESEYIHYVGSCGAGFGLGLVFVSSEYYWYQFEPKLLTFLCCGMSIAAILVYFIINSCPQVFAVILTIAIPCTAALVFSGFFTKSVYSKTFELVKDDAYKDCENLDYDVGVAARQAGIALFIMTLAIFGQENYYLNTMLPEDIYAGFSISFVVVVAGLCVLSVLLTRALKRSVSFRFLYGACTALLAIASGLFLLGVENEIVIGISFSLIIVPFFACGFIFQIVCLQCTEAIKQNVLKYLMLALVFVSLILIVPTSADFVGEYLLSIEGGVAVTVATCLGMLFLTIISAGSFSVYEGAGILSKKNKTRGLVFDWAEPCEILAKEKGLSEREIEVLLLLVQGFKNKNISEKLFISDNTVRAHVRNIYKKLEVHSKADVITKLEEVLQENGN